MRIKAGLPSTSVTPSTTAPSAPSALGTAPLTEELANPHEPIEQPSSSIAMEIVDDSKDKSSSATISDQPSTHTAHIDSPQIDTATSRKVDEPIVPLLPPTLALVPWIDPQPSVHILSNHLMRRYSHQLLNLIYRMRSPTPSHDA